MGFSLAGRTARFIRRRVRRLFEKTYGGERFYQHRQLRKRHRRACGSVVVHQMTKVGSTSVVASLREALPDQMIYHTHFLSEKGLSWLDGFVRDNWGRAHVPVHMWHAQFVRESLLRETRGERLKIVTLVRDPIARNVSEYFEELKPHARYPFEERLAAIGLDGVADELERGLMAKLTAEVDWSAPYSWFDSEIRDVLGIDLFSESFDRSSAYQIYRRPQVDILLIKLERLSQCAAQAFGDFLGVKNFELTSRNVSTAKYYSKLIKRSLTASPFRLSSFVNGIRQPRHDISMMTGKSRDLSRYGTKRGRLWRRARRRYLQLDRHPIALTHN